MRRRNQASGMDIFRKARREHGEKVVVKSKLSGRKMGAKRKSINKKRLDLIKSFPEHKKVVAREIISFVNFNQEKAVEDVIVHVYNLLKNKNLRINQQGFSINVVRKIYKELVSLEVIIFK